MPKIDVYKSSYMVYGSAGNIDMLPTEAFFILKKERSITAHSWYWSVRISDVDFQ